MIPLVVIGIGVTTAAVLVAVAMVTSGTEPMDVEDEEAWLIRNSPSWLQSVLRTADRRVAGGVVVAATFAAVFVCAVAVGWIFSTIDDRSGIARWDEAAAEWGARHATDTSTTILDAVTDLGASGYLLTLMALIGVYHGYRRTDWRPLVYLAVVGFGVALLYNGLKLIVDRDRPDIAPLAGSAGSAFPSGHSAAAAACWAAMALVVTRHRSSGVRWFASFVAGAIAVAVAATRVVLGVHWVSDVVAGVLVGWAWFFVVTVIFGGRLLRFGDPAERIAQGRMPSTSDGRELDRNPAS